MEKKMKIYHLKKPKLFHFRDAMNVFMEVFPRDWEYIPKIKRMIQGKVSKNTKYFLLVAKQYNRIKGICMYRYWTDIKACALEYLVVKLESRGKGIGSSLYIEMLKHLQGLGCQTLCFCADRDENFYKSITRKNIKIRKARLRFYEKLGARPILDLQYENPLKLSRKQSDYQHPYFLIAIQFIKRQSILGKRLRKILRRIFKSYYGQTTTNPIVKRILNSIIEIKYYKMRELKY